MRIGVPVLAWAGPTSIPTATGSAGTTRAGDGALRPRSAARLPAPGGILDGYLDVHQSPPLREDDTFLNTSSSKCTRVAIAQCPPTSVHWVTVLDDAAGAV